MKILVTGDTGLLGPYLKTAFSSIGNVTGISTKTLDLTNADLTGTVIYNSAPQMIVHAAALTDVEECEKWPNRAVLSNHTMVENIVNHMPKGCRLVYISSDMVYSGFGPHKEHSKSENPINMYGISKLMGEYAAAKAANHLIARINMFGVAKTPRKSSLVDFLLWKLRSGDSFNVFTDILFNPLWTKTLADRLMIMARNTRVGTYNLGASTGMSKAKFAMLLANEMGLDPKGMRPVESSSIKDRTARPLDTRMDIIKTETAFSFTLPSVENDIKAMCESIRCTN